MNNKKSSERRENLSLDPRKTDKHLPFFQALIEIYTRTVVVKKRRTSYHLHSQASSVINEEVEFSERLDRLVRI